MAMYPFWISRDGVILAAQEKSPHTLELTIGFALRSKQEIRHAREHLESLQFSERSTLARIGIEVIAKQPPQIQGRQLTLQAEAFVYDTSFPCASYFQSLLRRGTPVGRLFRAPEELKLSSDEIWEAVKANRIKLPNTISIDRFGRVFLTPHRVKYTLPPHLQQGDLERVVNGHAPRTYLDKLQVRQDIDLVSIAPRSGVLTSCSMYLQEHYVVLNRGEGNFGLHSGAVLLDPVKTFGTNIVLEIYNTSDQVVVNPMVSVDIYRSPFHSSLENPLLRERRESLYIDLGAAYQALDARPEQSAPSTKPRTGDISVCAPIRRCGRTSSG
jgi:hypothetical protein